MGIVHKLPFLFSRKKKEVTRTYSRVLTKTILHTRRSLRTLLFQGSASRTLARSCFDPPFFLFFFHSLSSSTLFFVSCRHFSLSRELAVSLLLPSTLVERDERAQTKRRFQKKKKKKIA